METLKREKEEYADAEERIWNIVFGYVELAVVKCAIELGVADTIEAHGRPMTLSELSEKLSCSSAFLHRIMRFLVHQKIFKETCSSDGHGAPSYSLTPLSRFLMRSEERNLIGRIFLETSPTMLAPWNHLSAFVRGNGVAPFVAAHGDEIWGYILKNPTHGTLVNDAMASDARMSIPSVVEGCAEFFEGAKTVVDVGGGNGSSLRVFVEAFPWIRAVNFDLPNVVTVAPHIDHVEHVAGDMFLSVPKADIIFIKWVLHDWSDKECVEILKNCRDAVADSDNGKVIIVDAVIKEDEDYKFKQAALMIDLMMMVQTGKGKERTREEWDGILTDAGFSRFNVKTIQAVQSVIIAYP